MPIRLMSEARARCVNVQDVEYVPYQSPQASPDAVSAGSSPSSASIDTRVPPDALFEAARTGQKEMLWTLVNERCCNVNKPRVLDGHTPLHVACRHGHGGSVQYLMQLGSNAESRDNNERRPLHLSALYGHALTCALLARWNADVEARDCQGCTALHLAAVYGHSAACSLLLDHSACINAVDSKGRSAVRMAAQYAHHNTVTLLIERQADMNVRDSTGVTALRAAVEYGHYGTVQVDIHKNNQTVRIK